MVQSINAALEQLAITRGQASSADNTVTAAPGTPPPQAPLPSMPAAAVTADLRATGAIPKMPRMPSLADEPGTDARAVEGPQHPPQLPQILNNHLYAINELWAAVNGLRHISGTQRAQLLARILVLENIQHQTTQTIEQLNLRVQEIEAALVSRNVLTLGGKQETVAVLLSSPGQKVAAGESIAAAEPAAGDCADAQGPITAAPDVSAVEPPIIPAQQRPTPAPRISKRPRPDATTAQVVQSGAGTGAAPPVAQAESLALHGERPRRIKGGMKVEKVFIGNVVLEEGDKEDPIGCMTEVIHQKANIPRRDIKVTELPMSAAGHRAFKVIVPEGLAAKVIRQVGAEDPQITAQHWLDRRGNAPRYTPNDNAPFRGNHRRGPPNKRHQRDQNHQSDRQQGRYYREHEPSQRRGYYRSDRSRNDYRPTEWQREREQPRYSN